MNELLSNLYLLCIKRIKTQNYYFLTLQVIQQEIEHLVEYIYKITIIKNTYLHESSNSLLLLLNKYFVILVTQVNLTEYYTLKVKSKSAHLVQKFILKSSIKLCKSAYFVV